jgi:hypothetical protein
MTNPGIRTVALAVALLISGMTAAMAQDTIKKSTMPMTSAGSGQEMFNTYCAVCHGTSGKGDGPALSEFKIPPGQSDTSGQKSQRRFSGSPCSASDSNQPARCEGSRLERNASLGKIIRIVG